MVSPGIVWDLRHLLLALHYVDKLRTRAGGEIEEGTNVTRKVLAKLRSIAVLDTHAARSIVIVIGRTPDSTCHAALYQCQRWSSDAEDRELIAQESPMVANL
ncbi:hypothetical protein LTR95_010726 [Oleoguttula sp. CCFEE 5521]